MANDALIRLDISLHPRDVELEAAVEEGLAAAELMGYERQDDETFSELVEDPSPRAPGSVRWRVHIGNAEEWEARLLSIVSGLPDDARVTWDVSRVDDLSFLSAWKEWFRPAQISDRIHVHPPWERPTELRGIGVEIDPGMAFGTGTHETTRLCLVALDEGMASGARTVLDVGTGSGILAIAARKLGATRVVGIDNDPAAVAVARENAARNGVGGEIEVSGRIPDRVEGRFDLVVANILPATLARLAGAIVARMAPSGALVLSGILRPEADAVRERYEAEGLMHVGTRLLGEWCAIVMRARAE